MIFVIRYLTALLCGIIKLAYARNSLCPLHLQLDLLLVTCFQALFPGKATAQEGKPGTDIPGVPPAARLVVNATSQSQVSSNPILGNEAAPGSYRVCKTSNNG